MAIVFRGIINIHCHFLSMYINLPVNTHTHPVHHMHVRKRTKGYCSRTFRFRTSYLTYAKLVRTVQLTCSLYNLCFFIHGNFVPPPLCNRSLQMGGRKQIRLVYITPLFPSFYCLFAVLWWLISRGKYTFFLQPPYPSVLETSILYLIRAYKSSKTISARLPSHQSSVFIER